MLTNQTIQKLKTMKLFGLAEGLEDQWRTAATHDLSFEERIGLLVDRESTYRENRRIERLRKNARLKQGASVEDIIYNPSRGLDRGVIASLITCEWITARHNLIITGATGTGKSWLAEALANLACTRGISTQCVRVPKLFEHLRIAHGDGSFSKAMDRLAKVDLLILDDWGLKPLGEGDLMDLMELVEERHKTRSTVITSQLPIASWHKYIGAPTIADAVMDRLLESCIKLQLKGESLRKPQQV